MDRYDRPKSSCLALKLGKNLVTKASSNTTLIVFDFTHLQYQNTIQETRVTSIIITRYKKAVTKATLRPLNIMLGASSSVKYVKNVGGSHTEKEMIFEKGNI